MTTWLRDFPRYVVASLPSLGGNRKLTKLRSILPRSTKFAAPAREARHRHCSANTNSYYSLFSDEEKDDGSMYFSVNSLRMELGDCCCCLFVFLSDSHRVAANCPVFIFFIFLDNFLEIARKLLKLGYNIVY